MRTTSFSPVGGAIESFTANEIREKLTEALSLVDSFSTKPAQFRPTEAQIRNVIRDRRLRSRFFSAELFADPAWDMLLDLYAADLGQHQVSVSSVCHAADVPTTTALRWLSTLEKAGLIIRSNDPFDARRVFVKLSENGLASMDAYFSALC